MLTESLNDVTPAGATLLFPVPEPPAKANDVADPWLDVRVTVADGGGVAVTVAWSRTRSPALAVTTTFSSDAVGPIWACEEKSPFWSVVPCPGATLPPVTASSIVTPAWLIARSVRAARTLSVIAWLRGACEGMTAWIEIGGTQRSSANWSRTPAAPS